MRSSRLLAFLGAAALLLAAPGAQALTVEIGFEGGTIESFGEEELGCSSAGNEGQLSCVGGDLSGTGGGWTVDTWNLFLDPDPTVSNSIAVTNNTAAVQTFVFSVTLPIGLPPFGAPSLIKGSITGGATDNNTVPGTAGVTLATSAGLALYRALIDGNEVRTLHDDLFSTTNPNAFGSAPIPTLEFGIPIAESVAVATTTDIGITLRFTLSAYDSASITSVFNVEPIPEPGTAVLLGTGLLGLWRMGRSPAAE